VFAVFLTLEITEIILAWDTSAALVSRGMAGGKVLLPVGKPLIS
jgi:hypothetical protein